MANYKNINCPSCGAAGEVDRFAAMAVCEYCSTAYYFKDEAATVMGKMAVLAETPSPLHLNATGSFRGKLFIVAGRVRYRYSRGFWDEWYLSYYQEGGGAWVGEDEMEFDLQQEVENAEGVPPYDQVYPGQPLTIAGRQVTVDERDVATLEGAEGQLPFVLDIDREFPYFDASEGDWSVTVEYVEDGIEVFSGEWLDGSELQLDHPQEEAGGFGGGWADA